MITIFVDIRFSPRSLSQIDGPLAIRTMYSERNRNIIQIKNISRTSPKILSGIFQAFVL